MRVNRLVVATLFVLTAQGCADSQQTGDLQVDLAIRGQVASSEIVLANVTITNTSDHAIQLLSWTLPDTELQEPLFQLTRDGQPVRYIGPRYKRAQPDASDYVTLAPGATLARTVDLAKFYDLSTAGTYAIELALDNAKATSTVTSHIEPHAAPKPSRPAKDTCTSLQHDQINAAFPIALQYASGARDYLANTAPSGTPRYTTWFGAFAQTGWDKAHADYTSIANAFATQPFVFDCSCKQKNVYAYVNPNNPYVITLCGAFWTAPTSGTDSKAGTFVHETSHFVTTANTNDWAYGQSACMSLAQTDPTKALDNADSHEYFAENNPALN